MNMMAVQPYVIRCLETGAETIVIIPVYVHNGQNMISKKVSLDGRMFTVTENYDYDVEPDGDSTPVIITDDITGETKTSDWESLETWTEENSLVGFGFADDLNYLYQRVTNTVAQDECYKVVEPE